ncbi:NmrA family NAD(P)-binding protein [Mycolicibacterium boenickei]|nr:NmrA family NAD(P)-binding protein [Mycolicibacterium boenickei]
MQAAQRVLVIGGTGTQGGAVASAVIRAGLEVVALTRNPKAVAAEQLRKLGCIVLPGDLDDLESVSAAACGCSSLFSVQGAAAPSDPDSERRHARHLARAAESARLRHIVHSSVSGTGWRRRHPEVAAGAMSIYWDSKEAAEDIVRSADVETYTILKPAFMMENFIPPKSEWMFPHLGHGELLLAAPRDTAVALVAADDIGIATVRAMLDPRRFDRAEIELAGDAPTVAAIAETLSHVVERPVRATCVSAAEVDRRLGPRSWSTTQTWLRSVGYPARPNCSSGFGLTPISLAQWAQMHRAELASAIDS